MKKLYVIYLYNGIMNELLLYIQNSMVESRRCNDEQTKTDPKNASHVVPFMNSKSGKIML